MAAVYTYKRQNYMNNMVGNILILNGDDDHDSNHEDVQRVFARERILPVS